MKNKIALFFFAIIISTTSLSINKEYVKSLKDETNNKISKQILDEKKSEIKKENCWSTTDKIVAVGLATACIIVIIIGRIIWKTSYDIKNTKTPTEGSNPSLRTIQNCNEHLNALDRIIEKFTSK